MIDTPLSPKDLHKVARFVHEHIGFYYAPDRMSDLNRGFLSACQDLGCTSSSSCIDLIDDPERSVRLEEILVKKLTIGETYFFRDRRLFLHLRDILLPNLIRERRKGRKYLRIWCAACSSGEEPYSIAMLLKYLIPDISDWEITLLATDINTGSLFAAERGVYSKWSFREETPVPTDLFISPSPNGRYQVSKEIRNMVRFSRLNLITDTYPSTMNGTSTMDLILCRNVLMYFSNELAEEVIDHLNACLITDGWLIVSPQEISYAQRPGFIQIKQSSVFLFKKGTETTEKQRVGDPVQETLISSSLQKPFQFISNISKPQIHTSASSVLSMNGNEIADSDNKTSEFTQYSTVIDPISHRAPPVRLHLSGSQKPQDDPLILIQAGRLADAEYILMMPENQVHSQIPIIEILARTYADQGDIDRALGWCDRMLGIDPLYPGAYHLRAIIQQDQGNSIAAIQSLRQALYADPDYLPAHLILGMIMGTQGKIPEARRHYQLVLKLLSTMTDETPVDKTDGMPASRIREMVTNLLDGMIVA